MFWPDPTHQPTHPPTHPPNHTPTRGWGSLHRFQIFKQNWNILISSSAIEFWLIPGVQTLGGGWVGRWGWGVVRECAPHTCTCMRMHTCACTHTHVWYHREFPGIPPMGAAICMKLSCLTRVHVHVCMCVCACACACVWTNHPHPHPSTPPPPEPQGAQNTKIQ